MSFSHEVKEELVKHMGTARHCQLAELAAILHFCGQYGRDSEGHFTIGFQVENATVVKKCFTLLKKTYSIDTDVAIDEEKMQEIYARFGDVNEPVDEVLLKSACCRRSYITCGNLRILFNCSTFSKEYVKNLCNYVVNKYNNELNEKNSVVKKRQLIMEGF